jgi:methylated-DNA-protein-cysteine methyltransferase related protein
MRTQPTPPSDLYKRIWAVAARIPRGRVATYGQVAALAGRPGQPRLAGYALHHIPEDSTVPWHRVVNARGTISLRTGLFLGAEESLQMVLLRREGIRFDAQGRLDLSRYQWRPRNLAFALPATLRVSRKKVRNGS